MHLELGHSGRDKMKIHMAAKYNIPRWAITIFLKLCLRYKRERMIPQKGMVVRPIYADSFFYKGLKSIYWTFSANPIEITITFSTSKIF